MRLGRLEDKFELLIESNGYDISRSREQIGRLKKTIELRNRLFHYKDPRTPIGTDWFYRKPEPGEGMFVLTNDLSEPDIVRQLTSISLKDRRQEIYDLVTWIKEIVQQHKK